MSEETQSDHDRLIRIDQKVSDLVTKVDEIKNNNIARINALEKDKADRAEVQELQKKVNEDIEKRVLFLEKKVSNYFITITIYSAIGAAMVGLIIYHILSTTPASITP